MQRIICYEEHSFELFAHEARRGRRTEQQDELQEEHEAGKWGHAHPAMRELEGKYGTFLTNYYTSSSLFLHIKSVGSTDFMAVYFLNRRADPPLT